MQMISIGAPQREIWADPLELPEPIREPREVPQENPVVEPEKEPVLP